MDDDTNDILNQDESTPDAPVLDSSNDNPVVDDAAGVTDENPVDDAEEDAEEPVVGDDDADTEEEAGSDDPVLGLGDDSGNAPTSEEVEEKADEKSKDENCEFC